VVEQTEVQAVERGYLCTCRTVNVEQVPRNTGGARSARRVKMVAERESRRVLGVSILGITGESEWCPTR
jgi:pyruvate/2-oxoglutarate dehydrogenase complex dihydrolipoamide dehydrogenase (E3) component